jgi:hypothetical protein
LHRTLLASTVAVKFYRMSPVAGFPSFQYAMFKLQLGMPKAQNVLVAAVALGLWMRYRNVALLGADHSWHQTIALDVNNVVCVRQLHSYGEPPTDTPFLKPSGVSSNLTQRPLKRDDIFRMSELFAAWATVHRSYEQLGVLATRLGSAVYNCSDVSFIDEFPRIPLSNFLALGQETP